MATVCVGCGLSVVAGKLTLDLNVQKVYVVRTGVHFEEPLGLALIAPFASTDSTNNFGVALEELAVVQLENPSDCRSMTCFITAHGRTRVDVNRDDEDIFTNNQEVRNEIRINNGSWLITDLSSYAQLGLADGRVSREWNDSRSIPPVTIPPGGTLTIDRRGCFRWEDNRITALAAWNLPGISVIGI